MGRYTLMRVTLEIYTICKLLENDSGRNIGLLSSFLVIRHFSASLKEGMKNIGGPAKQQYFFLSINLTLTEVKTEFIITI